MHLFTHLPCEWENILLFYFLLLNVVFWIKDPFFSKTKGWQSISCTVPHCRSAQVESKAATWTSTSPSPTSYLAASDDCQTSSTFPSSLYLAAWPRVKVGKHLSDLLSAHCPNSLSAQVERNQLDWYLPICPSGLLGLGNQNFSLPTLMQSFFLKFVKPSTLGQRELSLNGGF